MKYHYRTGTNKRVYKRRLRYAGASSLLVMVLCAGMLSLHSNKVESRQAASVVKAKDSGSHKKQQRAAPIPTFRSSDCGGTSKHVGLDKSTVSQLRKLAEYEFVCGGEITRTMSFFVPLPTTPTEAENLGKETAATLKEFAQFGMTPLVFLEPNALSGDIVNLGTYRAGGYDKALDTYFATIKAAGVTDAQLGTWNPLPEWNIPAWGNTDPTAFTAILTRTVKIQKKYFPGSKASIMLESKSYPSGDSWENGRYVSLLPYVRDIPQGLIDSFGLQGFPWGAMSEADVTTLDPTIYLRTDLAIEAAQALGVRQIWFNTGTFASFEKGEGMPMLTLTPLQRQTILNGVIAQAKVIKTAGFDTAVHLFSRDKSATEEQVDWSYWKAGNMNSSPATPVFKTFVSDVRTAGIPLWLYDNDTEE